MNDKPKRGHLYGIRAWWYSFEDYNRSFIISMLILAVVTIIAIALLMTYVTSRNEWKKTAPCSEFAAYTVKEMPVRCYEHFGLRLPE